MPTPSNVEICDKCGSVIENAYLSENEKIRCLECAGLLDEEKGSNTSNAGKK